MIEININYCVISIFKQKNYRKNRIKKKKIVNCKEKKKIFFF